MHDPRAAFLEAALWHGPIDRAEAILAAHPEVAGSDLHTAAVLGDDAAVRRFLELDPAGVTATAPPYGGDALVYLCLSKYLRLGAAPPEGFLRAAEALLDAGADPNSGFWTEGEPPELETALYGAAGVAHHAELTRLLVERGADPNDEEAVYHSPESDDLTALAVLVESGKLTPDSLAVMLIRKHDWHDYEGVRYLLEHGADPNHRVRWGFSALHHAIARDNRMEIFELLMDHGADPTAECRGRSGVAWAAWAGRADLLDLFERRGFSAELAGLDALIAACARNDAPRIRAILGREPGLAREAVAEGGRLLAEFAAVGNTEGVRRLLDLGVPVAAPFEEGDGYWDVAENSTALHVAAWRAQHATVRLLIERGAPVDAPDGRGRTPLALAVKACVDSYWTHRRSPDSVEALLRAGASVAGVDLPSGYAEVDALLGFPRSPMER